MTKTAAQFPTLTVRLLGEKHYRIHWDGPMENARLFASTQPYDPSPLSLGTLSDPDYRFPFNGERTYFAIAVGDSPTVWA
ncbi:MAG: hypothetical protein FWD25_01850, partial [Clostridia bacterium]|nr:hypothetical protein [Clostridia bacterium]